YTGGSTFTTNPIVLSDLPYDPLKSFAPIGIVGNTPLMVLAHPSVPASNIRELVALVSARSGQYNYGSYGTGTPSHFAGELLWSALGEVRWGTGAVGTIVVLAGSGGHQSNK